MSAMAKDTKFLIPCVEFAPAMIPHKKVSHPPHLETIAEEEVEEEHDEEILSQLAISFQFFLSRTISHPTGSNCSKLENFGY